MMLGQQAKRHIYLPQPRNLQFTGRQEELNTLERRLYNARDCHSISLVGLGGIGKTQVALQFACWVIDNHPNCSVFWVPALSAETFDKAHEDIANLLGIGAFDQKKDTNELVRQHISSGRIGEWLFVVDNADDLRIMNGEDPTGSSSIRGYLPTGDQGRTLFTTRDVKTAQGLAGSSMMRVQNMPFEAAANLLRSMVAQKELVEDEIAVEKLFSELEYLPLAIT